MMHAMPATSLSPSGKIKHHLNLTHYTFNSQGTWLAAQSLDNTIYMYNAKERLRSYRKNSLKGHLVGGFACEMSFSPDEKYITSGDSSGKLFFWDVKTCKVVGKLLAHESVVMSCLWHPLETSKVVSASWDGTIKLWD